MTCIAMIEDLHAIDHVGEIAAVDGIDALFIGAGDLTAALGEGEGGRERERGEEAEQNQVEPRARQHPSPHRLVDGVDVRNRLAGVHRIDLRRHRLAARI